MHTQVKLESEEQQLAAAESQLQLLQARQAELSSIIKPLMKQLAAARKAAAAAQAEADASKVRPASDFPTSCHTKEEVEHCAPGWEVYIGHLDACISFYKTHLLNAKLQFLDALAVHLTCNAASLYLLVARRRCCSRSRLLCMICS
jgi:multidrug efflux pump subunit AcrA (membrane-fusion protein)